MRSGFVRTLSILIVAVVILGLIAWKIVPNFPSHVTATGKDMADAVNKLSSLKHLVNVAMEEVEKCRKRTSNYRMKIARVSMKAEQIEENIEELKERKVGQETILERINEVLIKHQEGDTITINDKSYTWEQVNQDALLRIDRCKALKREIKEKANLLNGLSIHIEEAKKQLKLGTDRINQLIGRISELESMIAALETKLQVVKLTEALKGDPLADSGIAEAMNALEERRIELEVELKAIEETAVGETTEEMIDWEGEVAPRKAIEAIGSYFSGRGEAPEPESEVVELVLPDVNVEE